MKLCSQSAGTLPSQMITEAKSRIMVAPESLAALIISTTMPDGPAALSDFIFEMAKKMEKEESVDNKNAKITQHARS